MKDQLSALMDGEFELDSSEHIITSIKSGGELKEAWRHYHLIGDAMRGDARMHYDLSARVMQVLEAEPTILATNAFAPVQEKRVRNVSFFRSSKVWPVAASVAAVMFVGLMVIQQKFGQSEDMAPVEIAQTMPMEYLEAHQSVAPSGAAYYIQTASYSEQK